MWGAMKRNMITWAVFQGKICCFKQNSLWYHPKSLIGFFKNSFEVIPGARRARRRVPTSGPRSVGWSATGTGCLIGQRFVDEDLAIIFMAFEPEIFFKFFLSVCLTLLVLYITSGYIWPEIGSCRACEENSTYWPSSSATLRSMRHSVARCRRRTDGSCFSGIVVSKMRKIGRYAALVVLVKEHRQTLVKRFIKI